jgi:hypothetical protein
MASAPRGELQQAREDFLRVHAKDVYAALTDDLATPLRIEQLVQRAAERFPGLAPTPEELAAEHERPLAEKKGSEIAQGLLLAHVLASPRTGAHLVWAMLRPTAEALARLPELRATGEVDLGAAASSTTRGDHPRRLEPAAAARGRRSQRAPGDPVRARIPGRHARWRHVVRRGGRARRDGRGDRPARGGADELGARQRRGQPRSLRSSALHADRQHSDIRA